MLLDEMFDTIEKLFHYQIDQRGNDTLTFYIGLKRINQIKQWQDNVNLLSFSLLIYFKEIFSEDHWI